MAGFEYPGTPATPALPQDGFDYFCLFLSVPVATGGGLPSGLTSRRPWPLRGAAVGLDVAPPVAVAAGMRKVVFALSALLLQDLRALPNSVFGPVALAESPLNGTDLTSELLSAKLWAGSVALPGNWKEETRIVSSEISHLLARPKLFGHDVVFLRAIKRDTRLESLEATFADAGSFFGYFDETLPDHLDRRAKREEINRRLAARQAEFSEKYSETLDSLLTQIPKHTGGRNPKSSKIGHTRALRAETRDFPAGDLVIRLLADGSRLIRVIISPVSASRDAWLDGNLAKLPPREKIQRLRNSVRTLPDGTVSIDGLQPLPQGYRPYCGLNSLAIAARHFGLHIDEDWLAVAGRFQNTGTADGSRILSLYPAVASEAGFSMDRANRFDETSVRRALANGFPVVVWRRFDHERDRLHTRFIRTHSGNPQAALPDPQAPGERASWPGENAPLHASVLTGYHGERREILFLESWSGRDIPRRMRIEEMAATAYLTFVFRP